MPGVPFNDLEERNPIIRNLTDEEIELVKQGKPLGRRRKKKFVADNLGPIYFTSPLQRWCKDCGREIDKDERAFKVHSEPINDSQAIRTKRQWRCEECYLEHEERTIASHSLKGNRKHSKLRPKSA